MGSSASHISGKLQVYLLLLLSVEHCSLALPDPLRTGTVGCITFFYVLPLFDYTSVSITLHVTTVPTILWQHASLFDRCHHLVIPTKLYPNVAVQYTRSYLSCKIKKQSGYARLATIIALGVSVYI